MISNNCALLADFKDHGIDPERYLAMVLRRMPANATLERAVALTPARLAEELRPGQPRPAGAESETVAA